jgi:hypothetical protein
MNTRGESHNNSNDKVLWGGPRWRRILIAVVAFVVLGAWLLFSDRLFAKADAAPVALKITNEQSYAYAAPSVMKSRFRSGRYSNAGGTKMPDWVFRRAQAYARTHPWVAPTGVAPKEGRGLDWDWGWLEWTAKTLNTGRCLSLGPSPLTWFGCGGQPNWVNTVRSVKIKCGGAMLIIAAATGQPIAVGSGGAVCFWNVLNDYFEPDRSRPAPAVDPASRSIGPMTPPAMRATGNA